MYRKARIDAPYYAWALMPNHFDLLPKTGSTPIANVMSRLLTGHAVDYNRRFGHLFQNRPLLSSGGIRYFLLQPKIWRNGVFSLNDLSAASI